MRRPPIVVPVTFWRLACLVVSLFVPCPARAGFVSINGLNRGDLQRSKVAVALVSVKGVTVTWRTSYACSGHLELQLEQTLFGPKPAPAALHHVPYTSGVGYNSAWPDMGKAPAGTYLVMAWNNGHPCGEGSAVHFGERFSLPMVVSGRADPRVDAVRDVLKAVSIAAEGGRSKKLESMFNESTNPFLVLFADAALIAIDPTHRSGADRYARLLGVIDSTPGAAEELGWPLLQELARFPAPRDRETYDGWKKEDHGPASDGTWPSFPQFRRLIQARFRAFAANPRASVDLRRWAVTALAAPPSFVGTRRDRLDTQAIAAIAERLRDPVVEVRRDASRGILAIAATLRGTDPGTSRRLLAQVKKMLRRETDPEEKANLQLRIDEIAGNGAR